MEAAKAYYYLNLHIIPDLSDKVMDFLYNNHVICLKDIYCVEQEIIKIRSPIEKINRGYYNSRESAIESVKFFFNKCKHLDIETGFKRFYQCSIRKNSDRSDRFTISKVKLLDIIKG